MSFQSLIAHNGVVHQKSNSVEQPKPSTTETKTVTEPNAESKTVAPKSNSSSKKQIVESTQNQTENLELIPKDKIKEDWIGENEK